MNKPHPVFLSDTPNLDAQPDEWLVIQVKTSHHEGIGDDVWQEFYFYPHYTVKEWELFAQELAGCISDWLTLQRKRGDSAGGKNETRKR